jgi:hypothetical protein
MATYSTKHGQTLLDVTLQLTGSLEALVGLAALNQLTVDALLEVGTQITFDSGVQQTNAISRQLALQDNVVTTNGELLLPIAAPTPAITRQPFPQVVLAPNEYQIKANQSTLDLALQLYGSLDNLVELCQLNGLTLSQLAPVGVILPFDQTRQTESTTASYLALASRPVTTWTPLIGEVDAGPAEFEHAEYEAGEYA